MNATILIPIVSGQLKPAFLLPRPPTFWQRLADLLRRLGWAFVAAVYGYAGLWLASIFVKVLYFA